MITIIRLFRWWKFCRAVSNLRRMYYNDYLARPNNEALGSLQDILDGRSVCRYGCGHIDGHKPNSRCSQALERAEK